MELPPVAMAQEMVVMCVHTLLHININVFQYLACGCLFILNLKTNNNNIKTLQKEL